VATWDDVRRLALALPSTTERVSRDGLAAWDVRDKTFAWERPLRPADRKALGPAAPEGPVLAARVPDLGAKEALLAEAGDTWFTTPTSRATRRSWPASTRSPPPTWRSCWSRPGSAGPPSAWPSSTWTGPRW